jgi:hypothetical protein
VLEIQPDPKGSKMETTYNGWANRQTWNIALWLNNDEGLYHLVEEYYRQAIRDGKRISYSRFIAWAGLVGEYTPDRIKYSGQKVDRLELTYMIRNDFAYLAEEMQA